MNNDPVMIAGTVLLFGAAIGTFVFGVSYAFFFRWWKTPAGRALLAFVTSLILVTVLNMVGLLLGPEYAGREVVRIGIYSMVFASSWWMVFVLWHSSRKNAGTPKLDIEPRERRTGNYSVVDPDKDKEE